MTGEIRNETGIFRLGRLGLTRPLSSLFESYVERDYYTKSGPNGKREW